MPFKILRVICLITLVSSCAQMVPPNGGKKDENAPMVIGTKPPNKSTNFKGNRIIIKLDEFVQLKSTDQIIMSPVFTDKLIETIGKTIEISFPTTKPSPNTTYTINFGNSILDNHEAIQPLENYSYTFSTGPILDTNKIEGKVRNAFTNKVESGIIVGIYPKRKFTDSTLLTMHPEYFAKSNLAGNFTIENLPADTFLIFGFKDENANLKYTKNELIAFKKDLLIIGQKYESQNLFLFKPPLYNTNTILDTISKQKGKYQFIVYSPNKINIEAETKLRSYTQHISGTDQKDTVVIFIPMQPDSIPVKFLITTTDTSFKQTLRTKPRNKTPEFTFLLKSVNIGPTDSIRFISTTPIDKINLNEIIFMEDSITLSKLFFKQINHFEWLLYHPLKEKMNYTLHIKDSQVRDAYGRFNKNFKQTIQTRSNKDYGNLILNITTKHNTSTIIQLVENNAEEKLIKSSICINCKELTFENLSPVIVKIKVIVDSNQNGKWDNGNLKMGILPEAIYYHTEPITIKAYWDIEHSINLDEILNN